MAVRSHTHRCILCRLLILKLDDSYNIEAFAQVEEGNKKVSHELLIEAARKVKANNLHVRAIALRGDAREELVYKILELKADVVVIGSRGLGSFKRAFLGSVSDYLLHHLEVPVIVTRKPSEPAKSS